MNWRTPHPSANEPIMGASNDPETGVERWIEELKIS